MKEKEKSSRIISIWSWVGMIILSYGLIIFGTGIYYIFKPQTITALANLNPNLWWGIIMIISGILFLIMGRFTNR